MIIWCDILLTIDETTKDFDEYTDNLQSLEYKINFPLLRRHFLFKAIIHLSNELLKNDAGFMIDINFTTNNFFNEQINKILELLFLLRFTN